MIDSTRDFIWAFGFVRVDISKELFNTTDLYVDVFHLGWGLGPLSGTGVSVTGVNSVSNC